MQIFLMGHGETVGDIEDAYGGIADFPLTDNGRNTAYELGHRLRSTGIEILYTSPYKRAIETTGTLAAILGLPMETIEDLRERNSYGVMSGVNKSKAHEIFPGVLHGLSGEPGDYYSEELVTGAEPVTEFDSRIGKALGDIVRNAHERSVIAIVTHENVIRAIYKTILGISGKVYVDILAITIINYIPMAISIEGQEGIQVQV